MIAHRTGTNGTATLCFRSLLSNLCKLTLHGVAVSMPALQPVATRLRELNLDFSRLQGSADGFLTRGWTALTTLSLAYTSVEAATMTAALELPALEEMDIVEFKHQGGLLQLDQLTGGCPKIRGLRLQLDINMARGIDSTGPCCSLLNLGQLADLYICMSEPPLHANLELALPASLTHFEVDECNTDSCVVDFFWALSVAAKCLCRGAQLRKVTCRGAVVYLQPAQWGASLDEQYRRLGGQLSGLKELAVCSSQESLLRALSAVVSSAPNLTCVTLTLLETLPHLELPAICSASLERFIVDGDIPISSLVLTFLPGCTRLQKVLVQIYDFCSEGNAVKIRCHSCSPTCIVPVGAHQCAGHTSEVGVQLLPGTPLMQGVQGYTSCTYATLPDPSSHLCGVMLSFPGSCNVHSAGIKLAFCETFELKN